jgi:hypothetical protein
MSDATRQLKPWQRQAEAARTQKLEVERMRRLVEASHFESVSYRGLLVVRLAPPPRPPYFAGDSAGMFGTERW